MTDNQKKEVVLAVNTLLENLDGVTPDDVKALASQTVSLRDTSKFNMNLDVLSRQELKDRRRELVSAISAEKWTDGFITAIQVLQLVGAI